MKAIFKRLCPNCNKSISDERLSLGLPCSKCLKKVKVTSKIEIGELLKKEGKLLGYKKIYELEKNLKEFEEFVKEKSKRKLWSAQKAWAKRVFKEISFSIVAPTGVGKTFFGMLMSLFLANKGKKCYIVLPTTTLVKQVYEDIKKFSDKVIAFYSKMRKKEREEFFNKLESNNFNILITTSKFLSVHFKKIKTLFDFIFVDDVDAILKSSKNIDKILLLLGISKRSIKIAEEIVKLKKKLINLKEKNKINFILKKIEKLKSKLEKVNKVLVVSSATGKSKGDKVKLFRELLNFTIGTSSFGYRNIEDYYVKNEKIERILKVVGDGGIIFCESEEEAKELYEKLKNKFKCELFISGSKLEIIDKFANEEIDILIGVASYYGLLVRGIDLPSRIKYVIFTKIPKFKFNLKFEEAHPYRILILLQEIIDYVNEKDFVRKLILKIRKNLEKSEKEIELAKEYLKKLFENEEFIKKIKEDPYLNIKKINNSLYLIIPDIKTYIQASGRTSRLYAGGKTKGLSIVFVDDEKVFNNLQRKLSWYFEEVNFKEYNEKEIKKLIEEISKERELVKKIKDKEIKEDLVKSALLIVESPNKAKTIANFFGKPSIRKVNKLKVYEVTTGKLILMITASKGHILDLVENEGFDGVIIANNKFIPIYDTIKKSGSFQFVSLQLNKFENYEDAIERINGLREIANEVDLVLLGTDPDREGEAISWHLKNVLAPYCKEIKRIEFHEVTKSALKRAIENLKDVDENKVNAQIVRRIEDRWVGFELSKKLWKRFRNNHLSAGRVQTPVLGWIIKRYEEHKKSFRNVLIAKLNCFTVEFEKFKEKEIKIEKVKEVVEEVKPPKPFTTDALLFEASKKLKFSAVKTMKLAQELFENGLITYHRTDSTRVSKDGINVARKYINDVFPNLFKGRSYSFSEGAHECIRPTKPLAPKEIINLIQEGVVRNLSKDHIKLYSLIFNRFIASQMKECKVKFGIYKIKTDEEEKEIKVAKEIVEEGFNKILPISTFEKVKVEKVEIKELPKISLFSQGTLIEEMKNKGIGRPSTYAIIIDRILKRKYAIDIKNKLIPTSLGRKVYNYLNSNYNEFVSEEFTRKMEEDLDKIEEGKEDYQKILNKVFKKVKDIAEEVINIKEKMS